MPTATAQRRSTSRRSTTPPDADWLSTRVAAILGRHPCVGLAVGVVLDGRLAAFHGHGLADIGTATPVTEDTAFRIASISKTVTAVAVLQLVERGLVDLDAPANDHLRSVRLVPARAGHRPATVRQLLTHTAGLPETLRPWGALQPDFGESAPVGRPLPSLAELYGGRLRLAAEPGTRFVYGNHSPAVLGQLVEDVSGQPLGSYLRDHVFGPLGMEATDLRATERVRSLATGYELGDQGPKAVADREMVTAGAASVCSTPRDMAGYLAALLGGGANEYGRILEPTSVAALFAPQYRPDPRIPGIGLAWFRVDLGGHTGVEHQGTLPGYHSQVILAPDDGIAVMAFTNGSWQPDFWLPAELGGLLEELLGVQQAPSDDTRVPDRPERWPELCGWYRLDARLTDIRLRGMLGAGLEVFVRDGRLAARFLTPIPVLYRGFPLAAADPTDPDVFRIDLSAVGGGAIRLVFGRGPGGEATVAHLDMMPVTLAKGSDLTNPRRWAQGLVAGLGIATAGFVLRRVLLGR